MTICSNEWKSLITPPFTDTETHTMCSMFMFQCICCSPCVEMNKWHGKRVSVCAAVSTVTASTNVIFTYPLGNWGVADKRVDCRCTLHIRAAVLPK